MRLTPILTLGVILAGCTRAPTTQQPRAPTLTGADLLTPGERAQVRGRSLSGETAILVDGIPVPLEGITDTSAAFTAPHLRACDTDGRLILLSLPGRPAVSTTTHLQLASTEALGPGESRLLTGTDGSCLQLPARDADFVLSALNTSEAADETVVDLAAVDVWTAAVPSPAAEPGAGNHARYGQADRRFARRAAIPAILPWPLPYSLAPRLFDVRYSSGVPGDTVKFVDWRHTTSCGQLRGGAPSYSAVIAAVSGKTVVAVDLRLPNAAEYLTPVSKQFFNAAAGIADPLLEPAVQRVFDPSYILLPAANGRHFHIITGISGVAQSTDGNTSKPQSICELASEVVTTLHAPPVLTNPLAPRIVATEIIHEYAHNADEIAARRHGRRGGSIGWMQEAWAVNVEETAARLATRQASRARLSQLVAGTPYRAGTTNSDWGLYPYRSPWTGAGSYKQGAAIVSFAREAAGEAALDAAPPSLYLRMLATDDWSLAALAAASGRSPMQLLDAWALADAVDDLSPAPSPRLVSWDDTERVLGNEGPRGGTPADVRPSRTVARSGGHLAFKLAAAPGSYSAAYLFAEGGLGVTLQVANITAGARVRLTRSR